MSTVMKYIYIDYTAYELIVMDIEPCFPPLKINSLIKEVLSKNELIQL